MLAKAAGGGFAAFSKAQNALALGLCGFFQGAERLGAWALRLFPRRRTPWHLGFRALGVKKVGGSFAILCICLIFVACMRLSRARILLKTSRPGRAAAHQNAMPTHQNAMPTHQNAMPTHPTAAQAHPAKALTHSTAMPTHSTAAPTHPTEAPTHLTEATPHPGRRNGAAKRRNKQTR